MLLAALAASCADGGRAALPDGQLAQPPLPGNLDSIDPDVRERIEASSARVSEDPAGADRWADLGQLYEVVGLRAQALDCYAQAQLRDADEPRWWYRSAICRGRMDDVRTALADMDHALALAPDYGPAHYRRGMFALEDGDLDTAWSAFQRAVDVAPDYFGGWTGMARVHLQRDETDDAVRVLESLVDRSPSDGTVGALLASAYRQAQTPEGERRTVGRPTSEEDKRFWDDPWQSELRSFRRAPESHRITRLLQRGKAGPVIRKLERRRDEEPDNTEFLPELAEAYFQVGRVDEARATYLALLEREPDDVGACMALARFHEAAEELRDALPWYDRAIRIDPSFGMAWAARGRILFEGAQYGPAIETLETALELDQRDADLYLWLGASRMFVSDWDGAKRDLGVYLSNEPDDSDAHLYLAKAHVKLGELDAADAELERVRALGTSMRAMLDQIESTLERARSRQARDRGKQGS